MALTVSNAGTVCFPETLAAVAPVRTMPRFAVSLGLLQVLYHAPDAGGGADAAPAQGPTVKRCSDVRARSGEGDQLETARPEGRPRVAVCRTVAYCHRLPPRCSIHRPTDFS
jgi:hypothetical protein